ncbi:MAG: hypothetical protein ABJA98_31065 [Acidobacteriota bacterium]
MRRVRALLLATSLVATACSSGGFFRPYEYEEEIYLSLDGSATVYVNSSLAALNALRGASFGTDPAVPVDREKVREFYATPVTRVLTTPTSSRRSGRRFVHVKLDVPDVQKLGEAAPFSWSTYSLTRDTDRYVFRQKIGAAASVNGGTKASWTGNELVAFRLHLPSEIVYHNAGPGNPRRGNILVWEQSLADRRRGEPLTLDARMKTQSILYSTLKLFGVTFLVVAALFVLLIWWILRQGKPAGARS